MSSSINYAHEKIRNPSDGDVRESYNVSFPLERIAYKVEDCALSAWEKIDPFSTVPREFSEAKMERDLHDKRAERLIEKIRDIDKKINSGKLSSADCEYLLMDSESLFNAVKDAAEKGHQASIRAIKLAYKKKQQWPIAGMLEKVCIIL